MLRLCCQSRWGILLALQQQQQQLLRLLQGLQQVRCWVNRRQLGRPREQLLPVLVLGHAALLGCLSGPKHLLLPVQLLLSLPRPGQGLGPGHYES